MLVTINPGNPDDRKVETVVKILREGGVVIMPTDTIYALVGNIYSQKAIDRICRIKDVKIEKANFSILCDSLSDISKYTRPFSRSMYKLLNKIFPGRYTVILPASSEVPSIFRSRKKTIGIRIPDHKMILKVVESLGNPLISTSLHSEDEIEAFLTDPNEIYEKFGKLVDCVVDGGYGLNSGSTVVDCTSGEPVVVREGEGDINKL